MGGGGDTHTAAMNGGGGGKGTGGRSEGIVPGGEQKSPETAVRAVEIGSWQPTSRRDRSREEGTARIDGRARLWCLSLSGGGGGGSGVELS